ncbi:unnamed protein product, partial [Scytosiphon promiscuus]
PCPCCCRPRNTLASRVGCFSVDLKHSEGACRCLVHSSLLRNSISISHHLAIANGPSISTASGTMETPISGRSGSQLALAESQNIQQSDQAGPGVQAAKSVVIASTTSGLAGASAPISGARESSTEGTLIKERRRGKMAGENRPGVAVPSPAPPATPSATTAPPPTTAPATAKTSKAAAAAAA